MVVAGSGAGGTFTANLLASALHREIHEGSISVELLGEHLHHAFQPANLDIAFKGADPDRFVRDEGDLLRDGVNFTKDPAVRIDLDEQLVTTKGGRKIGYDYLVIATGAVADPSKVPGLAEGSLNFHTTPEEARRIWESLQSFREGKVVVAIAGTPHKCPPSPNEAAFMLDEFFQKRGRRDKVDIKFVTPYPRAYPAEKLSKVVEPLFEEKGIGMMTFFNVDSVDPSQHKIYSLEGESVDYDLLIAVPPHHGADVIIDSGIGDSEGWVPVDKDSMMMQGRSNVFALGDATAIPVSKSGVVAHLQSVVVAHNIVSEIRGTHDLLGYNGRINCPMEVGSRRAIFVSATYTSPPEDQTPSLVKYYMKRSFGIIYWRALNGSLERIFDVFFGRTRFPLGEATKPQEQLVEARTS